MDNKINAEINDYNQKNFVKSLSLMTYTKNVQVNWKINCVFKNLKYQAKIKYNYYAILVRKSWKSETIKAKSDILLQKN